MSNAYTGRNDIEPEFVFLIFLVIIGFYLYFISKVVAVSTYVIFYPIVAPAYVIGDWVVAVFGLLLCIAWALRFFFGGKKVNYPRKYMLLVFGLVFIIGGIFGLASQPVNLCVPLQKEATWDFFKHCEFPLKNAIKEATLGYAISNTFFYNLLFVIPAFYKGAYYLTTTMLTSKDDPLQILSKRLSFDDLMKIQSDEFIWLKYYHKLRLSEKDFNLSGNYNRMQSVKSFLFENDLVMGFTQKKDDETPKTKQGSGDKLGEMDTQDNTIQKDNYIPVIDYQAFEVELLYQLGDVFTGFENMDDLELFVVSVAIPRACCISADMKKNEVASIEKQVYELLDSMWIPVTNAIDDNGNVIKDIFDDKFRKKCLDFLEPYRDNPITLKLIEKHAYNRTIIYSAIIQARKLGVLAPASFGWFKTYDRTMWALVQNVGRGDGFTGCGYAECIAVDTQYRAELIANKRLYRPQLEKAYQSTINHLKRYNFNDEFKQAWELYQETGDYSGMEQLKNNNRL